MFCGNDKVTSYEIHTLVRHSGAWKNSSLSSIDVDWSFTRGAGQMTSSCMKKKSPRKNSNGTEKRHWGHLSVFAKVALRDRLASGNRSIFHTLMNM